MFLGVKSALRAKKSNHGIQPAEKDSFFLVKDKKMCSVA